MHTYNFLVGDVVTKRRMSRKLEMDGRGRVNWERLGKFTLFIHYAVLAGEDKR